MNHDEQLPLTRWDFDSSEDWLRHCHAGGLDLAREDPAFRGVGAIASGGASSALAMGIYGSTLRDFQRTWEGWGVSHYIDFDDVERVYQCLAMANWHGIVLDSKVDISWSTVGIWSDIVVGAKTRDLLEAIRHWFSRRGVAASYFFVLERGETYGLHTHMNIFVPKSLRWDFRVFVEATVERLADRRLRRTKDSKTVKFEFRTDDTLSQWARFRYLMKGIQPNVSFRTGPGPSDYLTVAERIGARPKFTGTISTKRVGVARWLDAAAVADWLSLVDVPRPAIGVLSQPLYDDRFIERARAQFAADAAFAEGSATNGKADFPENQETEAGEDICVEIEWVGGGPTPSAMALLGRYIVSSISSGGIKQQVSAGS